MSNALRHAARLPPDVELRPADVTDPESLRARRLPRRALPRPPLLPRPPGTGVPKEAWAIDHRAHLLALAAAKEAGVGHVVLLSAICVQKPRLAFQHAKLAFERELLDSGLSYSIVRPTAFFKSLSGQVEPGATRPALPALRERHPDRLQARSATTISATTSPPA